MDTTPSELPHIVCLLRDSLPLEQDDVSVCFDPARFARKTNPAQEQAIDSQWRRQCRQNPRLFNGSKFRYAGLRWTGAPQLQLGLTSYREHIGTNCRAGQRLLQEAGAAVHGDRQAFLADPLGVGALLLTADNRLAFVRRALWTGEYPGRLDRPGGHAEPDDRAYLTGVLRDRDMGGRPTLEFVVSSMQVEIAHCPRPKLERIYNEGKHAEADESLGLVFLTRLELFSDSCVIRVPELDEVDAECPGGGQIETLAEVVNNPEVNAPEGADAATAEKSVEEAERERKAKLWEEMTPACRGSLMLLKQVQLKGFVFRF
ncbi:uridine diphosphate glucose pyrophosphatase NUDT22-like [Pollicipes pollicipes]|uniref:uridine diphosphate glucose pyrophosphatase NUDT22-like n=1 Tax=Pollicipes pollicipes TaxID=41117 RepID=UPI001884C37B|nr:uridine diphosphate glucose pyrophosphatase NUDT22-like [Pollicipes pollicipes]